MNMWNNNEEFCSYYVRCNIRSMLRRLGILDGWFFGFDEELFWIIYVVRMDKFRIVSDRVEKYEIVLLVLVKEEKVVKFEGLKVENNGKDILKLVE